MNAPKLRFKEFNTPWIISTIGMFVDVQTGPFGSQLHEKDYVDVGTPIITVEHFGDNRVIHKNLPLVGEKDRKRLKKYSLIEGDIVFSRVGSIDRRVLISEKENGWLFSGRCLRLRVSNQNLNPIYLSYFLETTKCLNEIRSKAVGGTMPSLNTDILKSIQIQIPSIQEQKMIGELLSTLNKKIQFQQEKIDLLKRQKKGFMQKIFSQELRFKDDNGQAFPEWKNLRLKTIVDQVKGNSLKSTEKISLPVLTISAKVGFVNQEDRFSEVIAGNSLSKYTELKKYDLSYNKGNSKTAKYGCVFVQERHNLALVPNVYKSFRAKATVNPYYLQYLFETKLLDRQLKGIISSTARMDGLLNVSDEDFYNLFIIYPSIDEQNKIVNFLLSLDSKITKEESKLETLQTQKQAFMQQMFI